MALDTSSMNNAVEFEIFFAGPSLETGQMNVQDLAPALLALGEVFESANKVLNDDKAKIAVNVRSGFIRGSFGIDIETVQTLGAAVATLFGQQPIQTAAEIAKVLGLIGKATTGVIGILKQIQNRTIQKVDETDQGVTLHIVGNGNNVNVMNISKSEFQVLRDRPTRQAIETMVSPLKRDGIDSLKVKHDAIEEDLIEADEVSFFSVPKQEEEIIEDVISEEWLSLHSIHFGTNKWRFSSGDNMFWAIIEDQRFLSEVDQNERAFSKGDLLKVRIKKKFYETAAGVRTEYEILELLEHRKSLTQIRMGF